MLPVHPPQRVGDGGHEIGATADRLGEAAADLVDRVRVRIPFRRNPNAHAVGANAFYARAPTGGV